ncbi:ATP-grasp domain-containing protein [Amycolatopsis palatopharyngis]|uniref:ATP-grasp domain-containing protein n=1 Tax=Amycolatopsis palatopharyngis TaxID=187982 RepID=UPI003CCC4F9F
MSQIDVFVVGLDEANMRTLNDVPDAVQYRFHGLLSIEEVQHGEIPIADLIQKAEKTLDDFEGEIGAIVGYWDFPVSTLVPILCKRYGLPSSDLEAIVKCEHKYWSRLEQQKVIEEHPRFGIVDLQNPRVPEGMSYPMWLKPVKSFSSELAFKVKDDADFEYATREMAEGIDRIGKPFEYIMEQIDLPPEIAEVGGAACLAEEAMSGQQAASEGYVHDGEVVVYGVLDSLNYSGTSSFLRHQYPSQLPTPMVRRIREISEKVIKQLGMNNCTFSIEFFCKPESDDVCLLEVNPRHSQSHAELFEFVDSVPNHFCMLSVGLGRDPNLPHRKGPYEIAAKWYHRKFNDALVTKLPTEEEIEALREEIPGLHVDLQAIEGQRLSSLPGQDSYSFELAHIYLGADNQEELEQKYDHAVEQLHFEFADEQEETR